MYLNNLKLFMEELFLSCLKRFKHKKIVFWSQNLFLWPLLCQLSAHSHTTTSSAMPSYWIFPATTTCIILECHWNCNATEVSLPLLISNVSRRNIDNPFINGTIGGEIILPCGLALWDHYKDRLLSPSCDLGIGLLLDNHPIQSYPNRHFGPSV